MAPVITLPGSPQNFISPYPILATTMSVTVSPTGTDDYDTLQYVFNNMQNKSGCQIRLAGGTFRTRYNLVMKDFSGTLIGAGMNDTRLVSGLLNQRMALLDGTDIVSGFFEPTGWPSLITLYQSESLGTAVDLKIRDMSLEATTAPGYLGLLEFQSHSNMGLHSLISFQSFWNSVAKFDVPVVLNGTTPTALPDANLTLPVGTVFSGALATGTKYVATTDYILDATAGTLARSVGSTIGDGSTVYVTYNIASVRNRIPSAKLDAERVKFLANSRTLASGQIESNVHYAISARGATNISHGSTLVGGSGESGLHGLIQETVGGINYGNLQWSRHQTGGTRVPLNVRQRIVDCSFSDFSYAAVNWFDVEGKPTTTTGGYPYVLEAETQNYAALDFVGNSCLNVGKDKTNNFATSVQMPSWTIRQDICTGVLVNISKNVFDECMGMYWMTSTEGVNALGTGVSLARAAGWAKIDNTAALALRATSRLRDNIILVEDNEITAIAPVGAPNPFASIGREGILRVITAGDVGARFTGVSLSAPDADGVVTLTKTGGTAFSVQDSFKLIEITGATNPSNNGIFPMVAFTSGTVISIKNLAGVSETSAYSGKMIGRPAASVQLNGNKFVLPAIMPYTGYVTRCGGQMNFSMNNNVVVGAGAKAAISHFGDRSIISRNDFSQYIPAATFPHIEVGVKTESNIVVGLSEELSTSVVDASAAANTLIDVYTGTSAG